MIKDRIKIAISGRSGCGNTTVTKLISEKLNLQMVNYTFRNMAVELEIPFEEMCARAELDSNYDLLLDQKQVEMASVGNTVLGSRLAIWMLKEADLKVFLTASPEVRAGRILNREGGDIQAQMQVTAARDARDHERYKKLYNIDNNEFDFCDLIIDTDNIGPEAVANLIIAKAEEIQ